MKFAKIYMDNCTLNTPIDYLSEDTQEKIENDFYEGESDKILVARTPSCGCCSEKYTLASKRHSTPEELKEAIREINENIGYLKREIEKLEQMRQILEDYNIS